MPVTIDISISKGPVTRIESELTVLVADTRYRLPEEPIGESLEVVLDGRDLHPDSDNGFTFVSPDIVELKKPKRGTHFFMVRYYRK